VKRRLLAATLVLMFALVLGLPLASIWARGARAAAIIDPKGEKVVVMTASEFVALVDAKDAEIARLQERLDTRRRVDCPVI
jgi:hypothetical protein